MVVVHLDRRVRRRCGEFSPHYAPVCAPYVSRFLPRQQILQTVAGGSRGLGYIYAGRVIAGLGIGAISAVAPAFVSECSPKDVRGRITGMFQIMVAVGVMLSYFINCELCPPHGAPCYFPDGADVPWQLELASTSRQGTQSGESRSASSSYRPA